MLRRFEPGVLIPTYDSRRDKAIEEGYRLPTPPVVERLDETYEEVIAKQWDCTYERWT